jgi:hypothetical protein
MTNVDRPTTMVFFHDLPGDGEDSAHFAEPGRESIDYLQARERSERTAAKLAQTVGARRAHQELAQHYAEKARQICLARKAAGGPRDRGGRAQPDLGR